MPPTNEQPSANPSETLLVKWRSQTFTIPAHPSLTISQLKSHLSTLTKVPPSRQKLLFPSSNKSKDESIPLLTLFRDGKLPTRPIMLLGTPATPATQPPPPDDQPEVVDDLDDLLIQPVAPPPPPRVRLPPYRPRNSSLLERLNPGLQRRLLSNLRDGQQGDGSEPDLEAQDNPEQSSEPAEPSPSQSFAPPREDATATNGATLSLESLDEALRDAQTGMSFITERMTRRWLSPWEGADAEGFMDAVSKSRQRLRMLAVVMFDFSNKAEDSDKLLRAMVEHPSLRGVLDRSFHTFPADIGTLEDHGAALLGRLGLHAVPAIVILSDIGAGVSIVDMFNTDWFDTMSSQDFPSALGLRFEEVLSNFDGFYEAARARSDISRPRREMIQRQDQALREAMAADRELEERERAAAEEERRRVEEERRRMQEEERERRRLEEEQERERRRGEQEMEEAQRLLPPEPEVGGARVVLRLPDGKRIERGFAETACLEDVFNLAVSEGVRKGTFELKATFPTRIFTEEQDRTKSLNNVGFVPSVTLNVELT